MATVLMFVNVPTGQSKNSEEKVRKLDVYGHYYEKLVVLFTFLLFGLFAQFRLHNTSINHLLAPSSTFQQMSYFMLH